MRRQSLGRSKVRFAPSYRTRDERARFLLLHARCAQRAARGILFLAQHRQQQMLTAHISVSQLERRRLRTAQHLLRPRAKPSFPQGISLLSVRFSFLIFSHFL